MKTSITEQFKDDAINAPETVTGGRRKGKGRSRNSRNGGNRKSRNGRNSRSQS